MNRSQLLLLAAVGMAFPQVSFAKKKQGKKPLNFIFIMSDDHTTQAIGAYGSRLAKLNPTPNLDQFANEAVVFENVYCNNSISTPSRATTVTGQYSHNNTILTLDEKPTSDCLYLPQELNKLGYQTAVIGKWHLGCEPTVYDYYSVLTGHGGQGTYFDPEFASSEVDNKEYPKNLVKYKGHSSDVITDLTLTWLEEKRDDSKPFFLQHHYKAPHDDFEFAPRYTSYLEDVEIPAPVSLLDREGFGSVGTRGENNSKDNFFGTSVSTRHENRNYVEMYHIDEGDDDKNTIAAYNEYLKRYLRCVKGVDDNLERLFTYLKENDLWDNTVIIYSGDQGMMLGEHDLQDKRWMYEESMRMPFIMRVPGSKANGSHNDMMISNVDFAPTILSLAGINKTPKYMDGEDFSPMFDGKKLRGWRDEVYYRYWMHMIHHDVPAHFGIRNKDYKLIFFYGRHYDDKRYGEPSMWWLRNSKEYTSHTIERTAASFELYDLKKDPNEMVNVADDPAYAKVLAKMKKQLLKTKKEVGDTDQGNTEILAVIEDNF